MKKKNSIWAIFIIPIIYLSCAKEIKDCVYYNGYTKKIILLDSSFTLIHFYISTNIGLYHNLLEDTIVNEIDFHNIDVTNDDTIYYKASTLFKNSEKIGLYVTLHNIKRDFIILCDLVIDSSDNKIKFFIME